MEGERVREQLPITSLSPFETTTKFIIPFSRVMSLPNEENDKSSSSDAQGMDRSPRQQSLCNDRRENIVVILSSDSANLCNSQGPASGPLPDPPNDYSTYYSMNQARSIRYYELGPDNPPYAAKFYDFCGAEDLEVSSCTTSFHVSYNDD
ncbi:hypothetical protein DVH24_038498 [Malus domestica]|uniref:Uncharacterized protein n=1 Tax=Malus domestica TaxID=3750 RepID=A0A498KCY3_MALDO|nr:hypothetical protein DVH24_038498 [Malus domestica]